MKWLKKSRAVEQAAVANHLQGKVISCAIRQPKVAFSRQRATAQPFHQLAPLALRLLTFDGHHQRTFFPTSTIRRLPGVMPV